MIIYAVFIITSDGRLMFRQIFQKSELLPNEFILSGLLASFNSIANELTGNYPESLIMGDVSYHFENFDNYFLILVTDDKEKPDELIFKLGMKFTSKYASMLTSWNGNINIFYDFETTLVNQLSKYGNFDHFAMINPNRRLGAAELVLLPKHLHDVALCLLEKEEATMEELLQVYPHEPQSFFELQDKLLELQDMGYLGQKIVNSQVIYFV